VLDCLDASKQLKTVLTTFIRSALLFIAVSPAVPWNLSPHGIVTV